jgi:molybdopterin-guanine dinucleotide biosynthesis protein A|uniref:Molybdenum cofactor guanylyltransferase n=1 Tax=Mesoaciditoga lauensis TaxID=1495039 RepID=A0A7V3RFK8_9BACT
MSVNLAILVGGKSKRFGFDKCTYEFKGMKMIDWIKESIGFLFDDILLIGENSNLNCNFIQDLNPGFGPISGLETALVNSDEGVFLISCDMPFVMKAVVEMMIEHSYSHSIVCAEIDGIYQVTHALYSKKVLLSIKKEMARRNPSLKHLISTSDDVLILDDKNLCSIENYAVSFTNFNALEDLERYL